MSWKQALINLNPFKKTPPPAEEKVEQVEVVEAPKKLLPGMPGNKMKTYKLSEAEKQMIVAWFATGQTPSECAERAKEELNVEVSSHQVYLYSRAEKWQELIRKIRNETMSDIASVAGSHKKVRLERHEKVFDKALKKGSLKDAIAATEHQRKEMEGAGDMVNLTLNQFNVLNDEELEFKKKEIMEKIKLIESQKEKK